ncbi:hypothetical protein BDQ12DRAFT_307627 [Crucibulum laeve]|uniref:Uncharacterized protein n=1 Tax=Crucibulum laeve TaxID=68775 RepID=A0A5C3LRI4_9AGAR|nr:hypothetical protein BDQ12DRAFT_307627 [Crucibulum laeve]
MIFLATGMLLVVVQPLIPLKCEQPPPLSSTAAVNRNSIQPPPLDTRTSLPFPNVSVEGGDVEEEVAARDRKVLYKKVESIANILDEVDPM